MGHELNNVYLRRQVLKERYIVPVLQMAAITSCSVKLAKSWKQNVSLNNEMGKMPAAPGCQPGSEKTILIVWRVSSQQRFQMPEPVLARAGAESRRHNELSDVRGQHKLHPHAGVGKMWASQVITTCCSCQSVSAQSCCE